MLNTTVCWAEGEWEEGTAFNELVQRLVWLCWLPVRNNHNFCNTHEHFWSLQMQYLF